MDKIDRIHEILDELADISKELFPTYTRLDVSCGNDGYKSFAVAQWGAGEVVKTTKRRELFEQYKFGDESDWSADRSHELNEYYDKLGILLKDDCVQ